MINDEEKIFMVNEMARFGWRFLTFEYIFFNSHPHSPCKRLYKYHNQKSIISHVHAGTKLLNILHVINIAAKVNKNK